MVSDATAAPACRQGSRRRGPRSRGALGGLPLPRALPCRARERGGRWWCAALGRHRVREGHGLLVGGAGLAATRTDGAAGCASREPGAHQDDGPGRDRRSRSRAGCPSPVPRRALAREAVAPGTGGNREDDRLGRGLDRARADGHRILVTRPLEAEAASAFTGLTDLIGCLFDEAADELPPPQKAALGAALLRTAPTGQEAGPGAVSAGALSLLRAAARDGGVPSRSMTCSGWTVRPRRPCASPCAGWNRRRSGSWRQRGRTGMVAPKRSARTCRGYPSGRSAWTSLRGS